MYVSVMNRQGVSHMKELNDVELYELWLSAVSVAVPSSGVDCMCQPPRIGTGTEERKERRGNGGGNGNGTGHFQDHFKDMRINCGTYQNIGHLHLKIAIPHSLFFEQWKFSCSKSRGTWF